MSKNTKSPSKFSKISKVVIWIMLLAMVGGTLISAVYSFFINMPQ